MGVIRGLAQSHVGDVSNGGAYMHAHAGTFPTNPIHTILTSTRLVFDTDVPSVAILTEFVILWHLALHLSTRVRGLLSLPSTTSTAPSARTATATLVATSFAGAVVGNRLGLCLLWLGGFRLLVFLKLLPSRRDEVDV